MSFEAVNRELREETQAISDLSDINKITTDRIAENLHLSRTTVSQYLNDILKKGRCHSNQVTANQLHQSADFF